MHTAHRTILALPVAAALALAAQAANPRLGGPMKHVLVSLNGTTIAVSLEGNPLERMWLQYYGETYSPPADVLNGLHYNGQYGWLAGGFISLPPGAAIWVQVIASTPGLVTYEALTFNPLWGTEGSSQRWKWNGMMVHNWYAADRCGKYYATYSVYVGHSTTGEPLPGYSSGACALYWQYVPDTDLGDMDGDTDVDLVDVAQLQLCFTGPGDFDMPSGCGCADFDGDDDVDSDDSDVVLATIAGP